jgi:hypothetical protein
MPNQIKQTNLKGKNLVDATSRYYKSNVIRYGDNNKITFPIYRKSNLSFSQQDQYYEIPKDMEYRPDKVSQFFFSAPDFWWRIMEMNGMKDVLEFRAGRTIRISGGTLLI